MSLIHNNKPSHQWRRILYINNFSNLSVKNLPIEIKPAFYTNNNISKFLSNSKDSDDKLSHSGIYKLKCNDCTAFYIGKTARNVNIRVKEHLRCLNNNAFSEFANHLIETNHTFNNISGTTMLHRNEIGIRLNNLEALEIKKAINSNSDIINNQLNLTYSPILDMFPLNPTESPSRSLPIPSTDMLSSSLLPSHSIV